MTTGARPGGAEGAVGRDARFATGEAGTELREWGGGTPVGSRAGTDRTPQVGAFFGLAQRATLARRVQRQIRGYPREVATWVGASELAKRPALTLRRMGAFQTADAAVVLFAVLYRPISTPGPA